MLTLKILLLVFIAWNGYVFGAMGRDKHRAKLHHWRIPEARLLTMGAALGALGLYAGMKFFHHKTSHPKFKIGVPILILMNLLAISALYYWGHLRMNLF